MFGVIFDRCNPEERSDCKPKEEIDEWIRGKYLVLLYNQIRIDSNKLETEAVVTESMLKWFPMSFQMQLTYPNKVTQTKFLSQDKRIDMGELTELRDLSPFTLTPGTPVPNEWTKYN